MCWRLEQRGSRSLWCSAPRWQLVVACRLGRSAGRLVGLAYSTNIPLKTQPSTSVVEYYHCPSRPVAFQPDLSRVKPRCRPKSQSPSLLMTNMFRSSLATGCQQLHLLSRPSRLTVSVHYRRQQDPGPCRNPTQAAASQFLLLSLRRWILSLSFSCGFLLSLLRSSLSS